jgi:HEAT repeat protein
MRIGHLLLAAALLVCANARGDDEGNPLRDLESARTPEARVALIPRIARLRTDHAAEALAWLVRRDPAPEARVAAARGLGLMPTDRAYRLLGSIILEGGPLRVRTAAAEALAMRDGAVQALTETLRLKRSKPLTRGLVLAALGRFHDAESLGVLDEYSASKDPHLRGEALRALARRVDGRERLAARVRALLSSKPDPIAYLQALEALAVLDDVALLPAVARLESSRHPLVRKAAKHQAARLRYIAAVRKAEAAVRDGYGAPTPGDPPTTRRTHGDVVIVLDVTGSTVVVLPELKRRIRLEVERLRESTEDLRVGIVGYRFWKHVSRKIPRREILPLTFDLDRVETFLEGLRSQGPDSQGADVSGGLSEALDRMGWREGTSRSIILVADGKCHDPRAARSVVDVHHRADGAKTRVLFALAGRTKVPPEFAELARVGGTREVGLIR